MWNSQAVQFSTSAASLSRTAGASPAAKPQVTREGTVLKDDRGKTKYVPVVSFRDKARRDLWSSAVVTAVHAAQPEVLACTRHPRPMT